MVPSANADGSVLACYKLRGWPLRLGPADGPIIHAPLQVTIMNVRCTMSLRANKKGPLRILFHCFRQRF
jgi:hypothetical protein